MKFKTLLKLIGKVWFGKDRYLHNPLEVVIYSYKVLLCVLLALILLWCLK